MQEGDMVRFAKWEEMSSDQISQSRHWHLVPKKHIGVLVRRDKLLGTAHILHEGEVLKIRPVFVQKAGKKDFEKR